MTINEIQNTLRAAGSHWFDPDTMRFFGTKIESPVYAGLGGVYFVTSEDDFHRTSREYKVRQFTGDNIETINTFHNLELATVNAKALAGPDRSETEEPYKPISDLEQFVHDTGLDRKVAKRLIELATRYQQLCEDECNGYSKPKTQSKVAAEIRKLAAPIDVLLGGDPRGCTVKLKIEKTNDWAKEGYCIPIKRGE